MDLKTLKAKARTTPSLITQAEALRLARDYYPGYRVFDMAAARQHAKRPERMVGCTGDLTLGEDFVILDPDEVVVEGLDSDPFE